MKWLMTYLTMQNLESKTLIENDAIWYVQVYDENQIVFIQKNDDDSYYLKSTIRSEGYETKDFEKLKVWIRVYFEL